MDPDNTLILYRAGAYMIDSVVVGTFAGLLFAGAIVGLGAVDSSGSLALLYAIPSFPILLYFPLLEGVWGQTLGKRVLGITVVMQDGSSCTWRAAVVRHLVRLVEVYTILVVLTLIVMLFSDRNQRVGDHLARTVVARTDRVSADTDVTES